MSEPTVTCWSCGAARAPADALCPSCGKVQAPSPGTVRDKFAVLGLPRSFDLDEGQVDERFRALSRKLHPDRFARASAKERRFSLEQTTLLNDAYRTLRDPARRAEHLLELRGVRPVSDTAMLRHLLESKGVTQSLVAKQTEIAVSTISEVLAGKQRLNRAHIAKLSAYFGVDPGVFSFPA